VSQRMPISVMENIVSNAERRALVTGEDEIVPRIGDIYAALPAITGKIELEYEGELKGADSVAREIIRLATARVFKKHYDGVSLHSVVQWFELGGTLKYPEGAPTEEVFTQFKKIQGLLEKTQPLGIKPKDDSALLVSAAEFILEGLYALKKISRNEELGYHTEHRKSEPPEEEAGFGSRRRSLN